MSLPGYTISKLSANDEHHADLRENCCYVPNGDRVASRQDDQPHLPLAAVKPR